MAQLLPSHADIPVRSGRYSLGEAALARLDAVVFVLERSQSAGNLAQLPHGGLWHKLHRTETGGADAPVLASRLPNARHTQAVVGFVRRGASGFERLQLAGKLVKQVLDPGVRSLRSYAVGFDVAEAAAMQEAVASAALAAVAPMPQRKSRPQPGHRLAVIELAGAVTGLEQCRAIAEGNHLARWLAALPPNELDSTAYRRMLQQLAKREGWSCEFLGEAQLRRAGAGAFLAVSRANDHRGAGIVRLGYRPKGGGKRPGIALVGKGICFDTGGVNLKSHKSMYRMHGDMQGSAVAVGTLLALARLDAGFAVDCWLALTENEIGPRAYRPQEVVRASNGVTIQVVHSDAEGRMVLADALALACRERPRLVVDFATLTGACVGALTERYSGVFTNRPELHNPLQDAGQSCGERVWCFPMDEDFDSDLESPVADLLQCSEENKGDHILAARFLNRFVPVEIPWVHIDLAASERKGGLGHVPTDFTGFGVRYATHLLADGRFLGRYGAAK